ncbi:MBL fold metallo-hydrolase [Flavimaricola marinus]|uniref:Metal-dependent hydrolase n=1 Tax=Flavimaricola marinus TaxID=1819565 RepID=A0A238LG44_9RHOB|nr:metal-dependent hydrolase [Flavimaricola marinus]
MFTRRRFLETTGLAAGAFTVLPFAARAAGHSPDTFETASGEVTVHPIDHASVVLNTPLGWVFIDPVGDAAAYADFPSPDLILITHEHGDHYNADVLTAIAGDNTAMITNPAVYDMLPDALRARSTSMANGDSAEALGISISAIPAYNTTEERLNFHPQGRDNGYVLGIDGLTVYVSGDTEGTPEMRALTGIDVAFVCMNLPFTMGAEQAASAVAEFAPTYVYPYHYRGRDNGTQDPAEFAEMLAANGAGTEVLYGPWYG